MKYSVSLNGYTRRKQAPAVFLIILLLFAVSSGQSEEEKKTELSSVTSDRKEVLQFGIESEIIDLLKILKEEEDETLSADIAGLLEKPLSGKIASAVFSYLEKMKDRKGEEAALRYLDNFEEEDNEILLSAMSYLSADTINGHPDRVEKILTSNMSALYSACVSYLGKKGGTETAGLLIEKFKDENSSTQLRNDILLALGNLKASESVSFLREILDNEDEDSTARRYACDSLGKIGDPESLPSIKKALEATDTILRSYAVNAIGNFPGTETEEILLSSLRDNYPRVRELAANKLGSLKTASAVEILIFRARKDPERKVRHASFKALADIGGEKALGFLKDSLEDERGVFEYRTLIASELIQKHPGSSIDSLEKVMVQEWTKDNSRLLDTICKILSTTKADGFDRLYEKMLDHKSFIIQIYGVRGIRKNGILSLKQRVEELTKEKYHPMLRKNALSSLEGL